MGNQQGGGKQDKDKEKEKKKYEGNSRSKFDFDTLLVGHFQDTACNNSKPLQAINVPFKRSKKWTAECWNTVKKTPSPQQNVDGC